MTQRVKDRCDELFKMGLKFQSVENLYIGKDAGTRDVNVHHTEIVCDDEDAWRKKIQGIQAELDRRYRHRPLAIRIYKFLDKYAGIRPDWDPEIDDTNDKYTSPDASMMKATADMLSEAMTPSRCFSEWGSGGYKPYSSKEGRAEHDQLMKEINLITK